MQMKSDGTLFTHSSASPIEFGSGVMEGSLDDLSKLNSRTPVPCRNLIPPNLQFVQNLVLAKSEIVLQNTP